MYIFANNFTVILQEKTYMKRYFYNLRFLLPTQKRGGGDEKFLVIYPGFILSKQLFLINVLVTHTKVHWFVKIKDKADKLKQNKAIKQIA